jgi:hypothetical protein
VDVVCFNSRFSYLCLLMMFFRHRERSTARPPQRHSSHLSFPLQLRHRSAPRRLRAYVGGGSAVVIQGRRRSRAFHRRLLPLRCCGPSIAWGITPDGGGVNGKLCLLGACVVFLGGGFISYRMGGIWTLHRCGLRVHNFLIYFHLNVIFFT